MINKFLFIGNLGRDPEFRRTDSGMSVINFAICTEESWKGKDGEWKKQTDWHHITAYGQLAERYQTLKKGQQIYVEGKVKIFKNEDAQTGKTKYYTNFVADRIKRLSYEKSDYSAVPTFDESEDF